MLVLIDVCPFFRLSMCHKNVTWFTWRPRLVCSWIQVLKVRGTQMFDQKVLPFALNGGFTEQRACLCLLSSLFFIDCRYLCSWPRFAISRLTWRPKSGSSSTRCSWRLWKVRTQRLLKRWWCSRYECSENVYRSWLSWACLYGVTWHCVVRMCKGRGTNYVSRELHIFHPSARYVTDLAYHACGVQCSVTPSSTFAVHQAS